MSQPLEQPTIASLIPRAVGSQRLLSSELGAWVMVGPRPAEEGDEWSFRTLSTRTLRDAAGKIEAVLDATFVVYPLRKARPDGPFRSTILVGRSRTNDICIPHSSVSKLHARIRTDDRGALFVSDAGSSNGTALEGSDLKADEERPLVSGLHLRFGACAVQVFDSERFVAMLLRFDEG
ncbi:MAG: FHA domain-containing protein [Deltaproteobacteria bacterium]|nr:FHA domain-containing protein [Deltaproteobacteria bacterium]